MARGSINDNIGGNYEYINSDFYSRLYYQWLFLGLVTYEVWKEMVEEFIIDRKGGNYEYINRDFYSLLYHWRLLLGLVTYEARKEMAGRFIK